MKQVLSEVRGMTAVRPELVDSTPAIRLIVETAKPGSPEPPFDRKEVKPYLLLSEALRRKYWTGIMHGVTAALVLIGVLNLVVRH